MQAPQGPACQVYRAHALGLHARCRLPGGALLSQSAPSAPDPAAHSAVRAAVPPPHFALQLPHGSYCHCGPLQASVLQAGRQLTFKSFFQSDFQCLTSNRTSPIREIAGGYSLDTFLGTELERKGVSDPLAGKCLHL